MFRGNAKRFRKQVFSPLTLSGWIPSNYLWVNRESVKCALSKFLRTPHVFPSLALDIALHPELGPHGRRVPGVRTHMAGSDAPAVPYPLETPGAGRCRARSSASGPRLVSLSSSRAQMPGGHGQGGTEARHLSPSGSAPDARRAGLPPPSSPFLPSCLPPAEVGWLEAGSDVLPSPVEWGM